MKDTRTHMRSSYQEGNHVYVGTTEGLYLLNFDLLSQLKAPQKPIITHINSLTNGDTELTLFKFNVKNPKTKCIFYSYRVINYDNKWSPYSLDDNFSVSNLNNGKYILEVKATYDGISYSPTTRFPLEIKTPFLRGNKLILILLAIVVGFNFFLYYKAKNFQASKRLQIENHFLIQKYAPHLILFGSISLFLANLTFPLISSSFAINYVAVFISGTAMFLLFLYTKRQESLNNSKAVKRGLIIGFLIKALLNIL